MANCIRANTEGVNLSEGPGYRFNVLGMIYTDETLQWEVGAGYSDGINWIEVTRAKTGQKGWVARHSVDIVPSDRC